MLDPENVPDVDSNERLSRFVLSKRHVNQEKQMLKADAFVPHPYEELSVTRDRQANDDEIWSVGRGISAERSMTLNREVRLIGRGDAIAASYQKESLKVLKDPVLGNPNHVNVSDWPSDKPRQKLVALEIAKVATFVATPESSGIGDRSK